MKKFISVIMVVVMLSSLLISCASTKEIIQEQPIVEVVEDPSSVDVPTMIAAGTQVGGGVATIIGTILCTTIPPVGIPVAILGAVLGTGASVWGLFK